MMIRERPHRRLDRLTNACIAAGTLIYRALVPLAILAILGAAVYGYLIERIAMVATMIFLAIVLTAAYIEALRAGRQQ